MVISIEFFSWTILVPYSFFRKQGSVHGSIDNHPKDREVSLRPLCLEDFIEAKKKVHVFSLYLKCEFITIPPVCISCYYLLDFVVRFLSCGILMDKQLCELEYLSIYLYMHVCMYIYTLYVCKEKIYIMDLDDKVVIL